MPIYSKPLFALIWIVIVITPTAYSMPTKNECTSSDHQHIHKQRPKFSTIDSNSDGDIDPEEFSAQPILHGDHQRVFVRMDTDKNGVISSTEFEDHKPPHHKHNKKRNCND